MEVAATNKEYNIRSDKTDADARRLHSDYNGKLEVTPKCRIKSMDDFSIWYTPGVSAPCLDIEKDPSKVFVHTNRGNFVAIISDGTRVLGLGDIGPEAALPVMEGKAILFKYLGGVDAFPICIRTKDPDEIIKVCKWLEPTFGGINLEDIEAPKCFYILKRLRKELNIPVWHDDQQGTASATLAGLINALNVVGKTKEEVHTTLIGAGAANITICKLMIKYGFTPGNITLVDSKGIIHRDRPDLNSVVNPSKCELAMITNKDNRMGDATEAMKDADICIALSKPGPGMVTRKMISSMASDPVVFACANPRPEIWPWEAKKGGARIVATGRSDFPNQVNNILVFPAMFRGALDVGARSITDEMCISGAEELARYARVKGLSENCILPTVEDWEVFPCVASEVAIKAVEQGMARNNLTKDEAYQKAFNLIERSRKETNTLMDSGVIPAMA